MRKIRSAVGLQGDETLHAVLTQQQQHLSASCRLRQGMLLIDRKPGGTTPLDVIIDGPGKLSAAVAAPAGLARSLSRQ